MAPCTAEQRSFVAQHVDVFANRHLKKLHQVFPVKTAEAVIQESNNTPLIKAAARLDLLEEEFKALQDRLTEAVNEFHQEFGETLVQLVDASMAAHQADLQKKQEKFEYRLRTAIGLVELVSPEEAYQVLEECREVIEELGKE